MRSKLKLSINYAVGSCSDAASSGKHPTHVPKMQLSTPRPWYAEIAGPLHRRNQTNNRCWPEKGRDAGSVHAFHSVSSGSREKWTTNSSRFR